MTITKQMSSSSLNIPLQYEDPTQLQPWDKRARKAMTEPGGRFSRVRQLWFSYFMSGSRH